MPPGLERPPHHARCYPYSLGGPRGPQEGGAQSSERGAQGRGHRCFPDWEVMTSLSSRGVPSRCPPQGGSQRGPGLGEISQMDVRPPLRTPGASWAVPLSGEAGFI